MGSETTPATNTPVVDGHHRGLDPGGARPAQITELAGLVMIIARRVQLSELNAPGVVALTHLESLVMRHIDRHPGTNPSRIAASIGLKRSNASAALRSLTARGFVRREVDPQDGRAARLYATSTAQENLLAIHAAWLTALEPFIDADADLTSTVDLLRYLDEAMDGPE